MSKPKTGNAESTPTPSDPTQLLMHAETLYRQEMLTFDQRLLATTFTFVTGLVVAAAWLASRVAEEAHEAPLTVELTAEILHGMRDGFYYFFFVGITMLGSVLLLIAARSWASIQERAEVLQRILRDAYKEAHEADKAALRVFGFSQGVTVEATTFRRRWESVLALYWCALLIALSITILVLTWPGLGSVVRLVVWLYALLGVTLSTWALVRQYGRMLWHRRFTKQGS